MQHRPRLPQTTTSLYSHIQSHTFKQQFHLEVRFIEVFLLVSLVTDRYAPVFVSLVTDRYAPVFVSLVTDRYAPVFVSLMIDRYAPVFVSLVPLHALFPPVTTI